MTKKEILSAAESCACNSLPVVANLWESYLLETCVSPDADVCVTGNDAAIMLALLNIGKIACGEGGPDNYVNAAGYIALAGESESGCREESAVHTVEVTVQWAESAEHGGVSEK